MSDRVARAIRVWGVVIAVLVLTTGFDAPSADAQVRTPPDGFVVVEKVVVGDAGLSQDISIRVQCVQVPEFGNGTYDETQTVPAGTTEVTLTFGPIAAPADCTASEPVDGGSAFATVAVDGLPVTFRLNPNEDYQIGVTDDVTAATGDLRVTKLSLGPDARERGVVEVDVACTDPTGATTLTTVDLPPGVLVTRTLTGLVASSQCTLTEVDDGAPPGVVVTTVGSPRTVAIVADDTVRATIVDVYRQPAGFVQVVKEIDDPTGERGAVSIDVVCDGDVVGTFAVPAGSGPFTSPAFLAPAGATCEAIETQDGSSPAVSALVTTEPASVVIVAGATSTITVTNAYVPVPPDTVDVTLAKVTQGDVGVQGPVVVIANCGGRFGALLVPAGAAAGTVSTVITNVPVGATCDVAELLTGATDQVTVTTSGTGADLSPTDNRISVTNTYDELAGSLRVRKEISGSAAGDRGSITILVECDNGATTSATFTPGQPPTDVVVPQLPVGTTCRVTEPADGSTATTAVTVSGAPEDVDIAAGREELVVVEDAYEPRVGSLAVFVVMRGPAARFRGEVEVDVTCDDGTTTTLVASTAVRVVAPQILTRLPVGTVCTITEVADGDTPFVDVVTEPEESVVVEITEGASVVRVTNTYRAAPGSLTVAKTVTGAGAALRGDVTISVQCLSVSGSFTLPAGATTPSSITLDGLFPGEVCTVTETSDGAVPGAVDVAVGFAPAASIVVGPAENATINVTDTYTAASTPAPMPTSVPPAPSPVPTSAPLPGPPTPTNPEVGPLPVTGSTPGPVLVAAVVFLGMGAVLVGTRRRWR